MNTFSSSSGTNQSSVGISNFPDTRDDPDLYCSVLSSLAKSLVFGVAGRKSPLKVWLVVGGAPLLQLRSR